MPNRALALLVICLATQLLAAGRAVAAPGDLDPTFWSGTGNVFLAPFVGPLLTMAVRPDTSIILAGGKDTGSPSGTTLAWQIAANWDWWNTYDGVPNQAEEASAIVALADNRVVMAGAVTNQLYVLRVDALMQLDPSFGVGGMIHRYFRSNVTVADIAVQPDGKIVVLGAKANGNRWDVLLLRFLTDGSLDSSFGFGGWQQVQVGQTPSQSNNATPRRLVLQADGQILVAGTMSPQQSGVVSWFVFRLTASGFLDTTYGPAGNGMTFFGFEYGGVLSGAALAPDGGLFLGGISFSGSGNQLALAKLNTTGISDFGFGTYGLRRFSDDVGNNSIDLTVASQPIPRLLVGDGGRIRAFTTTGLDDLSFGNQGAVYFQFYDDFLVYRMAINGDNKLVVGGYGWDLYNFFDRTFAIQLLLQ
jgi:uncharacterized delta-60 repeat protein